MNRSWSTLAELVLAVTIEYVWVAVPSVSVAAKVPHPVTSALLHEPVSPSVKVGAASLTSLKDITTDSVTAFDPSVMVNTTV